jgi:hypothetical protein
MPFGKVFRRQGGARARLRLVRLVLSIAVFAAVSRTAAADMACPAAARRHIRLPVTAAALLAGQPVTIVAFGSSSTEGSGATAPDRTYPARLAAFLRARWPDGMATVLNKGVGGQTIDAMLARLETNVLAEHPTLVIWQTGANEVLRGYDPDRFAAMLDEGVRRIVAAGSDVILMDNQLAPKLLMKDDHAVFEHIVAREASKRAVPVFSRTALMREWQADRDAGEPMITPDGVHHTDRGYACLAAALGDAIVRSVELSANQR